MFIETRTAATDHAQSRKRPVAAQRAEADQSRAELVIGTESDQRRRGGDQLGGRGQAERLIGIASYDPLALIELRHRHAGHAAGRHGGEQSLDGRRRLACTRLGDYAQDQCGQQDTRSQVHLR